MDIKIYSHNEKKDLVKKIERLTSKNHYKQVFKILKSSGIKITQNSILKYASCSLLNFFDSKNIGYISNPLISF